MTDGLRSCRQHYMMRVRVYREKGRMGRNFHKFVVHEALISLIDKKYMRDFMCFLIIQFMGCLTSGKLQHNLTSILKGSNFSFWVHLSVIKQKGKNWGMLWVKIDFCAFCSSRYYTLQIKKTWGEYTNRLAEVSLSSLCGHIQYHQTDS